MAAQTISMRTQGQIAAVHPPSKQAAKGGFKKWGGQAHIMQHSSFSSTSRASICPGECSVERFCRPQSQLRPTARDVFFEKDSNQDKRKNF
jgi:hypothetical protein